MGVQWRKKFGRYCASRSIVSGQKTLPILPLSYLAQNTVLISTCRLEPSCGRRPTLARNDHPRHQCGFGGDAAAAIADYRAQVFENRIFGFDTTAADTYDERVAPRERSGRPC